MWKRLKRIACWISTVLRLIRSSLMSLMRTSLRRQKSSMYCSSREQPLTLAHYPIQCPFGTAAELLGGSRLRGVIDHVLGELDWTAGLRLDGERDLAEVSGVDDLV